MNRCVNTYKNQGKPNNSIGMVDYTLIFITTGRQGPDRSYSSNGPSGFPWHSSCWRQVFPSQLWPNHKCHCPLLNLYIPQPILAQAFPKCVYSRSQKWSLQVQSQGHYQLGNKEIGFQKVKVKSLSGVQLFANSVNCSLPGSLIYGNFPGKSTGVCCHFLLQGNLPNPEIEPPGFQKPLGKGVPLHLFSAGLFHRNQTSGFHHQRAPPPHQRGFHHPSQKSPVDVNLGQG